jgi:shikimate kinase
MPGAGKSTVGVILAKMTRRSFVDTDVLIQAEQGRTLQDIVNADGYLELRRIEEDALFRLSVENFIIATGGSAVYSERAMSHLKLNGLCIFLHVERDLLEKRIGDFSTRGLAKRSDQSFCELYEERYALYTKYADIRIPCDRLSHEQVCERIIAEFAKR